MDKPQYIVRIPEEDPEKKRELMENLKHAINAGDLILMTPEFGMQKKTDPVLALVKMNLRHYERKLKMLRMGIPADNVITPIEIHNKGLIEAYEEIVEDLRKIVEIYG